MKDTSLLTSSKPDVDRTWNRRRFVAACSGAAALGLSRGLRGQSGAAPDVFSRRLEIYAAGAKVKPAFLPLPPGAVTPRGWLRDWAVDASQGITRHLDEYSTTFHEAWRGYPFEARGAHPDGTGWPLEQSSYWLDGAIRLAYMLNDTGLIEKISQRLDMVVAGVLNGGESFIYWRPNTVLSDTFNNWAHSHMGRALVAYYQASGNPKVLQALVKVYRTYPLPEFRSRFNDVLGAVNIDAMLDTYLMSGDRGVLENAAGYAQKASYRDGAGQWLKGQIEPGHNVIFYENIRVPALLYPWTGDRNDLATTEKIIEWHDQHHMLPMGLSSGEEWHSGVGSTRGVETCNVAASIWTFLAMLRITGQAGYSDRIERVFFNAGPAPVSRDFKIMSYYQTPNRYSASLPPEPYKGAYGFTNIGTPVLCCVGNLNRVIPFYAMHMWMTTMDQGLAATLYGPSAVRTKVAGNVTVDLEEQTAYPFEESIVLLVKPEREATFPLYLRVPSWCGAPDIKVNGKPVPVAHTADAFVKVSRKWGANDKVTLHFPMSVHVKKGRETPFPQIPYFQRRAIAKDTGINNPYASLYYGPLLMALPIQDLNPNQEAPNADYRFALDVNSDKIGRGDVSVVRHPMPQKWDWPASAPVQLAVRAREFDWQPTALQPLPKDPITGGKPAKPVLVPYGCTKFRVCMFPVTESAWGKGV